MLFSFVSRAIPQLWLRELRQGGAKHRAALALRHVANLKEDCSAVVGGSRVCELGVGLVSTCYSAAVAASALTGGARHRAARALRHVANLKEVCYGATD
ncbi:MAG: hypothetical protein DHS20C08_14300 [Rhodomicrobium sp.]|nr:MAG: hypothetical protein DHS20C08_14300 [Rhodomicrobium sp.]